MKRVLVCLVVAMIPLGLTLPAGAGDSQGELSTGLKAIILPWGELTLDWGRGTSHSTAMELAAGISPYCEYEIGRYFAIGLHPQFIFNVKPSDAVADAGMELDINARLSAKYPILPELDIYALIAPGYSLLVPWEFRYEEGDDGGRGKTWRGPDLGVGGGISFKFTQSLGAFLELEYQLGWQEPPDADEVDLGVNWFMVELGLALYP